MSLKDKIDVIDLIINVLKEHENSLDNLVERLEVLNKDLEQSMNKSSFYASSKSNSSEALNRKIVELEKRIEKYRKIIKKILGYCEKINDIACVKKIADEVLEI